MSESFTNKKPEDNRERDEDLIKLRKFREALDSFKRNKLKAETMLEAAKLLPDEASGKEERINGLQAEIDQWENTIKITKEDHIAPLVEKLASIKN